MFIFQVLEFIFQTQFLEYLMIIHQAYYLALKHAPAPSFIKLPSSLRTTNRPICLWQLNHLIAIQNRILKHSDYYYGLPRQLIAASRLLQQNLRMNSASKWQSIILDKIYRMPSPSFIYTVSINPYVSTLIPDSEIFT